MDIPQAAMDIPMTAAQAAARRSRPAPRSRSPPARGGVAGGAGAGDGSGPDEGIFFMEVDEPAPAGAPAPAAGPDESARAAGPEEAPWPPRPAEPPALPEGDDEILSHLLVISRIHPGEKLAVSPLSVCAGGILSVPYRWATGEGRARTLRYLQALLNLSVARAEELRTRAGGPPDRGGEVRLGYVAQFTARITGALNGLSALTTTYSGDPLTVSRLETMRQGIEIRMRALDKNAGLARGEGAP